MMRRPWAVAVLFVIGVSLALLSPASGGVLGVDFGSDSLKIGLVQPGQPVSIVENEQSRRKTPVLVTFHGGERFFSDLAANMQARFPVTSFGDLKSLIGVSYEDAKAFIDQYRLPYRIENDELRRVPRFRVSDQESFYAEELLGMVFAYVKKLADHSSGGAVADTVIAIPSFFNQIQRRAIEDAARLGGLKVVSLMDDNAASALRYGSTKLRKFPADKPSQTLLFFDSGAVSTSVSVVRFEEDRNGTKGSSSMGSMRILSSVADARLGGNFLDVQLMTHFIDQFAASAPGVSADDIWNDPRAVAKLRKEVRRMREVLSANEEMPFIVEAAYKDMDLRSRMSRRLVETIAGDFRQRVSSLLTSALDAAGIASMAIDSVEVTGGFSRTPFVKDAIVGVLGMDPSTSLNADEAVAVGAAYRAAQIVPGYKLRSFAVENILLEDVSLVLEQAVEQQQSPSSSQKVLLFKAGTVLPKKKAMVLKKLTDDFSAHVSPANDISFAVKEVASATARLRESENATRAIAWPLKVRLSFVYNDDGVLKLSSAKALASVFDPSQTQTQGEEEAQSDQGSEEDAAATSASTATTAATVSSASGESDGAAADRPASVTETIMLSVKEVFSGARPLEVGEFARCSVRLVELDKSDKNARERAKDRNEIETLVYDWKEKIEEHPVVLEYTSEGQREEVRALLVELGEWVFDHADTADAGTLRQQLNRVRGAVRAVTERMDEALERPKALAQCRKTLRRTQQLANSTLHHVEDADRELFQSEILSLMKRLDDLEKTQEALAKYEDAAFKSDEVSRKCDALERQYGALLRRPKPKKAAPPKQQQKQQKEASSVEEEEEGSGARETSASAAEGRDSEAGETEKSPPSTAGANGADAASGHKDEL